MDLLDLDFYFNGLAIQGSVIDFQTVAAAVVNGKCEIFAPFEAMRESTKWVNAYIKHES